MTTKRFTSLGLIPPTFPNNSKMIIGVKALRTNPANRSSGENYSRILYDFHNANNNSSKLAALTRPDIATISVNSPRFKHVKLIKDTYSIPHAIGSTFDTPYEKRLSTVLQPQPLSSTKQIKSHSGLINGPFREIKYEQPWSCNDNMQQKLSLEIWLPKAAFDNDDDDNTSRLATPEVDRIEKNPESIPINNSRRSSSVETIPPTTIINTEVKSVDEVSLKSSQSIVIPHVDQYEEQTYSNESTMTVDSDDSSLIKSIRHLHSLRQSISTNESKRTLRFKKFELPTTPKDLPNSTCQTNVKRKSSNPLMVSKFIQKYTLMKKNHQKLTQAKLHHNDSNDNPDLTNDRSLGVRSPLTLGSTTLTSPNYPTVSVKNLLLNTSQTRSANDRSNTNTNLQQRCSTSRKSSHWNIYPQLRGLCLANQRQQHQSSVSVIPADLLPIFSEKKTNDTFRALQRSKTLDIVLDVSSPIKVTSYVSPQPKSSSFQYTTNAILEETPYLSRKRSALILGSQQQARTFAIQDSIQHFHHSSTRTNK